MQGYIVVITRNGSLGGRYPLTSTECLFGQSPSCDVRVYVANVARKHCIITALPNERAYIRNLSPSNTTLVNGIQIGGNQYELQHADVITVGDRHFRWEYPISSRQKTPARKTMDSDVQKTPTCMVQVPMSVFKIKRHSSPGVLRENKIISITSQDGVEPDPKRRKTLHNVTDLVMENKLVKPVNKQLMAVTQPASSPKSFNTFRVLLKSASKRKLLIPVSKTPKPQKKVTSTKVHRSKSLSPQKLFHKQKSIPKYSQKSVQKSEQVEKVLKLSIPPLKPVAEKSSPSTPFRKSVSTVTKKMPFQNSRAVESPSLKGKSTATVTSKNKAPIQSKSPKYSPKNKTPKTSSCRKSVPLAKSPSPKGSLSSSAVSPKSPEKSPIGKSPKTIPGSPSRKYSSPNNYHTPKAFRGSISVNNETSVITQSGRSKTPQSSSTKKSVSPIKSSLPSFSAKNKTSSKTQRGSPPKTPEGSPARKTLSLIKSSSNTSRKSSPSKKRTPGRTPRGRPFKTPQASPSRKTVSPVKPCSSITSKSGSPVKDKSPNRTPRGRPPKSPQGSSISKSAYPVESPSKTPRSDSPVKDKTPSRTPRGMPPKTHEISPGSKSASPERFQSPKASRSSSPVMDESFGRTPRGRPSKTPQASPTRKSVSPAKSHSSKTSQCGSPVKNKTPEITSSDRPPKTQLISPSRKSVSPAKFHSSKTSRSVLPEKVKTPTRTPRGRPSKTPQASPTRKSVSPAKSPSSKTSQSGSPVKNKTPEITSSDMPPKTQLISPSRKSVSPAKFFSSETSQSGSPVKVKTPRRTPRGRPSKIPQISPARKSASLAKSPSSKTSQSGSPVKDKSPDRTPRGRPSKSPQTSSTSKSVYTVESPLKTPRSSTPVKYKTPGATPRGRPPKTPQISPSRKLTSPEGSPKASRSSSSVSDETPGRNPRGRPSKTPQASRKSVSSAKSLPKVFGSSSLVNTPSKTLRVRPSKSPTSVTTQIRVSEVENLVESSRTVPLKTLFLREDELSVKTPKAPKLSDRLLTRNSTTKGIQESNVSPTHLLLLPEAVASNVGDFSIDQSFGRTTNNETEALNDVTKSARRSALRSGLSSSKNLTSLNKPLLLKSSTKKAEIERLQIDSKRKYDTAAEAKAERAAKRLKMETPKSLTKNKKAALLVCHSPKSQKRPLFSEVLKSHLSTAKKNQAAAAAAVHSVVARRAVKQISCKQPLSLEIPKSFKFNSTGHANSPETIIIRKKIKKTPLPKTRKGRKSTSLIETRTIEDKNMEGIPELFKTPKSIMSSLKSASSVKKSQNVRVRFSLQNDVQSPSGRRSLAMHSDEATHFGSPMIPSKKYIGTPRPPMRKINDTSLIHTSIMEESPLAQEIDNSEVHISPSKKSDESYDFSAYSPSSPTLQFSRISGVSSVFARKSIDFIDSPASESNKESPKRKKSSRTPNDTLSESSLSLSRRFSFASVSSYRSRNRNSAEFQPSPDGCAIFSQSDVNVSSPVNSDVSQGSRFSRKSNSKLISLTKEDFTNTSATNISQIPLPHSPLRSKTRLTSPTSSSSLKSTNTSNSVRSTRSSNTNSMSNTSSLFESPQIMKSKIQLVSSTRSKTTSPENSPSSQTSKITNQSLNSSLSSSDDNIFLSKLPKRISSTPMLPGVSNIYSPVSSPISNLDKRSLRNLGLPSPQNLLEESSKATAVTEGETFKTPIPTPGKKPRKGSNRMNASNVEIPTPESQVPVAAVKPSTRRKQWNESYSSASESVSIPAFSVSYDISGRSVDRSLAQKMMDSRASSGLDQSVTSRSTTPPFLEDESNLSLGSLNSSRRKRKSSASTSIQSIDATTFDFTSAMTPKIPREMFVSPLDKVSDDLTNISGVKRILSPKGNSPVSSYADVKGIKKLLKTPKAQNDLTDVAGVKRVMSPKANSPISSYIDVKGVKRLLKTPRSHSPLANYASLEGIKELFKHSPVADYTNVTGVKSLYSASVEPNYMNVKGVRRIFKETKVPNSPDVTGVEVLFESPKKLMDEYNQSSSSKPIGMVPPMSRQVSGVKTSGNSTEAIGHEVEGNQPTTRNAENTSRQRTLAFQQIADKQLKSNTSVSLRKSKRTNVDSHIDPKATIQSLGSEEKNSRQINQATGKNVEELKTCVRIRHSKRTQAPQMKGNKQEFARDKPVIETSMENEVRVTRKRGGRQLTAKKSIEAPMNLSEITTQPSVCNDLPDNTQKRKEVSQPMITTSSAKKGKIEIQEISLNSKPSVGRSTRQTLRKAKTEGAEISSFSNKEESNEVKSSSKAKKNYKNKEELEPILKITRGRARRSSKQEDILNDPSSVPTSKMLRVEEKNVQSPVNLGKNKVTGNRTKITGLDTAEAQQGNDIATGSRREINVASDVNVSIEKSDRKSRKNVESELNVGTKRNVRSRGGKRNKEKATTPESTAVPVESPAYSKNTFEERRGRGRPPKTTSKKGKTHSSQGFATNLSSLQKNNSLEKGDLNCNSELSLSEPSTSQTNKLKQEDCKKTSRRVQFDMESSPSPKKGRPKKRAAKKTVNEKTASLTTANKTESPASSALPKKTVPAKKVVTKTKASPKLKAAAKPASPTLKNSTAEKNEPTKRKTKQAKASPKLETVAMVSSPTSKDTKSKVKVSAKKVTSKRKASPKTKVATKRKSSTPVKSPPAKRITRSRK